MEYFNTFIVLAFVHFANAGLVKFHIGLDSNTCTNFKGRLTAVDSAEHFIQELVPGADLTDCCCVNRNITCYMKYTGTFSSLQTFTECINGLGNARGGSYIRDIAVTEADLADKTDCTIGITNFTGSRDYAVNTSTLCLSALSQSSRHNTGPGTGGYGHGTGTEHNVDANVGQIHPDGINGFAGTEHRTDDTDGTINERVAENQVDNQQQTAENAGGGVNAATIGGAVGGTLAALAALLPLAYLLYKKLHQNKVDDMNSTTDLFAVPPGGFDFGEAPNSVAPAGTS